MCYTIQCCFRMKASIVSFEISHRCIENPFLNTRWTTDCTRMHWTRIGHWTQARTIVTETEIGWMYFIENI